MSFLKSIWKNNSKHKKLSEELGLQKEKEVEAQQPDTPESDKDVMTFKLKYLGSTVVEKIVGENISPEAVKNVIKVAKASGKKLPRVNVAISLKGINVTDNKGNDMFEVSIYRISNCSTDKQHRQVFSFISIDPDETMECHAFWCSKRKMAEMVALTVAHAFSTAYESWRVLPNAGEFEKNGGLVQSENMKNTLNTMKNNLMENDVMDVMDMKNENEQIIEEKLIDFDDDPITEVGIGIDISYTISGPSFDMNAKNPWVCFEDDFVNSFHNDFQSDLQNDFETDFQNDFQCDFQNGFKNNFHNNTQTNFHNNTQNILHNNTQNSFHSNIQNNFHNLVQNHAQNNFQNDSQRWNNANKIDLFFS